MLASDSLCSVKERTREGGDEEEGEGEGEGGRRGRDADIVIHPHESRIGLSLFVVP